MLCVYIFTYACIYVCIYRAINLGGFPSPNANHFWGNG